MNKFLVFAAILLFLMLFPKQSLGSEGTFVKYSVNAHIDKVAQEKGLSLGYQDELLFLEKKWELGFWSDQSHDPGAKSGGFGSYSIGVEPMWESFYVNFFQGIGIITSPDSVLGGPFQFFEDLGFGIRDKRTSVSLGFQYKHISSAGIYNPNYGRDTMGIQIMIPW